MSRPVIPRGEEDPYRAMRAARRGQQAIGNWKRQFCEAGRSGVETGASRPSTRERPLEDEVAELTTALGEAAVEIRVWKKSPVRPAGLFEDSR